MHTFLPVSYRAMAFGSLAAAVYLVGSSKTAFINIHSTLLVVCSWPCQPIQYARACSVGGPAAAAAEHDAELRALTLAMCNVDSSEYQVILTSGATAGLKLVGDGQLSAVMLGSVLATAFDTCIRAMCQYPRVVHPGGSFTSRGFAAV
jgi:hypothetical protein